jgi:hypothetical protein
MDSLYHTLKQIPKHDMASRIDAISSYWLNQPYKLSALGEGEQGRYDQAPLYRVDAFDCETYVDTVLAAALAKDSTTFKQCIRRIRYREGRISFLTRNHFTCLDWNTNNHRQGYLKDITRDIYDKQHQPIAQTATALINKPAWYQKLPIDRIRLSFTDEKTRQQRWNELKRKGAELKAQTSQIAYLPLTALFNAKGEANRYLFKQIPNAAIIEIVRPNWDLEKEIGTHMNVSHLGFAFWKNGTLIFREASSTYGHTVDVPLLTYLREARKSPTIKGINVQVVVPQEPNARC